MDKLIDLLKTSVLTQFVVTVMIIGIYAGLLFTSHPVPDMVEALVGLVVGFYFGSKLGIAQGHLDTYTNPPKDR